MNIPSELELKIEHISINKLGVTSFALSKEEKKKRFYKNLAEIKVYDNYLQT